MTAQDSLGVQFNASPHVEQPEGEDMRSHMVSMHGLTERSVLGMSPPETLARVHAREHRVPEYQSHQHEFPVSSPDLNHYAVYTAPRGTGPAGRVN